MMDLEFDESTRAHLARIESLAEKFRGSDDPMRQVKALLDEARTGQTRGLSTYEYLRAADLLLTRMLVHR